MVLEQHLRSELRKESRLVHREPPSRMNEWAKFIVTQANFLFTLLGLTVTGFSIYVAVADFGALDKGFFLGGGLMFFFFSILIILTSYLGSQGVYYQRKDSRFTIWKGTIILSIYQFFLIATLTMQLVWLAVSMSSFTTLRNNAVAVLAGQENVPMTSLEMKIAEKFDAFFFGAQSACNSATYQWFWSIVDKRCAVYNPNMSQLACQRCGDYSVTQCAADTKACYTDPSLQAIACPYQACRKGALSFVVDKFAPLGYFAIGLLVFQILLIVSTCTLICYHKRDTDAEIKAKNGIFANNRSAAGGAGAGAGGAGDMDIEAREPTVTHIGQNQIQNQQQQQQRPAPPQAPHGFAPPRAPPAPRGPQGFQTPTKPGPGPGQGPQQGMHPPRGPPRGVPRGPAPAPHAPPAPAASDEL